MAVAQRGPFLAQEKTWGGAGWQRSVETDQMNSPSSSKGQVLNGEIAFGIIFLSKVGCEFSLQLDVLEQRDSRGFRSHIDHANK